MIKTLRKKAKLTQIELANQLGLCLRTIRNAEKGKPVCKKTACLISAWSNGKIKPAELMGIDGNYSGNNIALEGYEIELKKKGGAQ